MTKFKRKDHTLPTDTLERRDMIRWVLEHPCWYAPMLRERKGETEAFKTMLPKDLDYLPGFGWSQCISIAPVFVNPKDHIVNDDDQTNTQFSIWIEAGPPFDMSQDEYAVEPKENWNKYNRYVASHDFNLDCGADTLDEALLELALLVKFYYGDYDKEDGQGWIKYHKTNPNGLLFPKKESNE